MDTKDSGEGKKAFLEKRKPTFQAKYKEETHGD